jgi:hypothetical protein
MVFLGSLICLQDSWWMPCAGRCFWGVWH